MHVRTRSLLLSFLLTLPLLAQPSLSRRDTIVQAFREFQKMEGPSAILNDRIDAWVRGDQLYFRSSQVPLTIDYQIVTLQGAARKIAVEGKSLYVWTGDSQLSAFTIDDQGAKIDESPRALAVDDPAALRALAAPSVPAPQPAASLPDAPGVVVNPQKLFVTNTSGGIAGTISGDSMIVINAANNTLSNFVQLNTGDSPNDVVVAFDNSKGYIANFGCNTCLDRGITVFDPTTGNAQPARLQPGRFPLALALSSDATRLYANDGATLRVYDQTGAQVSTQTIPGGVQRLVLTSDNKFLLMMVSNSTTDQLVSFSTSGTVASGSSTFPTGSSCVGLAVAPGDAQVYVTCYNTPKLYQLSLNNGALAQTKSVSINPSFAVQVSPDGKRIYVPYTNTNSVDVIDASTMTRITQIPIGVFPSNMLVNKAGTRGYVTNFGTATVSALDLTANTNLANIAVGPLPYGLALTTPAAMASVVPVQLTFTGAAGQPSPPAQNVALSIDQTTGSFTWTAAATTQTGGNWITLSATSGTFPATLKVTANVGTLAIGSYSGTVTVTSPGTGTPALTIAVTLTVNASGTLSLSQSQVAFSGTAGAPGPSPVTLNITNTGTGGALAWSAVVTGPAAPWLSLTPPSGVTPGTLVVGVNTQGLPAGNLTATVTVSSAGSVNTLTLNITLTLAAGPIVPAGGIVNAASFAANTAVSAGALVSIFGSNFGPSAAVGASTLPLPTNLSGVQVIMGGFAAPLIFVSGGQINCQVPFELAGQTSAQVIVMNGTAPSAAVTMQLAVSSPGIFTAVVGGQTIGAILKADYSLITSDNPAKIGDVIQIFATGPGAVSNAPASGAAAPSTPPLALTVANPVVLIGGQSAPLAFSGLSPGFVGLWQVNVTVPSGVTPAAAVAVQIVQNGLISNSANIAVAK